MAKSNIPIPKWMDTSTAWSKESITNAPSVIWVTTNMAANVPVVLIFQWEPAVIQEPTAVAITNAPVVAAINLCVHSINYSSLGKIPFGHNGQSGQVSPSPAAEIYPPITIRE